MKKLITLLLLTTWLQSYSQCPLSTGVAGVVTPLANYVDLINPPTVSGKLFIRYDMVDSSFASGWNYNISGGWREVSSFNSIIVSPMITQTPVTLLGIYGEWDGVTYSDSTNTIPLIVESTCSTDVFTVTLPAYTYCAPLNPRVFVNTTQTPNVINFSAVPIPGINDYQLVLQVNSDPSTTTSLNLTPGQAGLEFEMPYNPGDVYSWHIDALTPSICMGQPMVFESGVLTSVAFQPDPLLIVPIVQTAAFYKDTTDIYLQRKPIDSYTRVDFVGSDRVLYSSGCCAILGGGDLIIRCDSPYVYPHYIMYIEEYYTFELIDAYDPSCSIGCFEDEKEYFYLQNAGLHFPYEYIQSFGRVVNLVQSGMYGYDPSEWDSVLQYGTPDTMLAFQPTLQNVDPYTDCRTGVTLGRSDCYNNNVMIINGVPDGYYLFRVSINVPPLVHDLGVYPNDYTRLGKLENNTWTWVDSLPVRCLATVPLAPTGLKVRGNILSWDVVAGAESYNVYASMAYKVHGRITGWHTPVLMTTTTGTSITLPNQNGDTFKYLVEAVNCAGVSERVESKKVN